MFGRPERWSTNTFLHFVLPYILPIYLKKGNVLLFIFRVLFHNQLLDKIAFVFIAETSRLIFFYIFFYIPSQKNHIQNIANIINKQQ